MKWILVTLQGIQLPTTLNICDQLGRNIRTETIGQPTHTLQQNKLPPGIYHYNIGNYTGKFIITH